MKNKVRVLFSFLLLIGVFLLPIGFVSADVWVNGYYRSNGTYVNGYYRSSPDSNPYNNYSYPGNYNPYTGKTAPGNASTYLNNYYDRSSSYSYPSYSSSYNSSSYFPPSYSYPSYSSYSYPSYSSSYSYPSYSSYYPSYATPNVSAITSRAISLNPYATANGATTLPSYINSLSGF